MSLKNLIILVLGIFTLFITAIAAIVWTAYWLGGVN